MTSLEISSWREPFALTEKASAPLSGKWVTADSPVTVILRDGMMIDEERREGQRKAVT